MNTPDTANSAVSATGKGLRLYKKEKLCSAIAISQLFGAERPKDSSTAEIHSALAYPLRCVWRENNRRRSDAPIQFLISIPKKRLRHAVDRVLMRRRVREAFRLNHQEFPQPGSRRIDVAFIYIGNGTEPYAKVECAVQRLLKGMQK